MFFDKKEFLIYRLYRTDVIVANRSIIQTKGRGTVKIEQLLADRFSYLVRLDDVLYILDLKYGLFLISQTTFKGLGINFLEKEYYILKENQLIRSTPKVNNIYILSVSQPAASTTVLIQKNIRTLATSLIFNNEVVELQYRRIGYLNEANLKKLVTISKEITLS